MSHIHNVGFLGIINRNRHFDGGRGTVDNPYRIVKLRHFNNMRRYTVNTHYQLENDIIFTDEFEEDGEYYNDGLFWRPIPSFSGTLQGQGFKITNFKSKYNGNSQGTLFGTISSGGIYDIKFYNIEINSGGTKYSSCGGLVYSLNSTANIERVYVDGYINIGTHGGGMLCTGSGAIRRSIMNARVVTGEAAGGMVGRYSPKIYDSYMRGHTSGVNHHGGMYGSAYQATIERCFSAGLVQGNHLRRGIASDYDYTVNISQKAQTLDCYWDTEVTTCAFDGGLDSYGRTTVQMTYPYDVEVPVYDTWDFDTIWAHDIDGTMNNGYPYLRGVTPMPSEEFDYNFDFKLQ